MKNMQRVGAALLLASVVFSQSGSVITAYAADTGTAPADEGSHSQTENTSIFKDLPASDPFYDNIMKAKEAGYIGGIGEDLFGTDVPLRICDFITILKNAFDIYSPLISAEDIENHTLIDLKDYHNDKTQPLTVEAFFKSLFCLYGIPDYKVEENPEGFLGVAKDLGLVKAPLNKDDLITRRDAIGAFMTLKEGQYKYLCETQVGNINIEAKDGIDLYLYYGRLAMVPESILKQFIKDGWKIEVTDSDLYAGGVKAAGVTYNDKKTIVVKDSYALVHEMGHYFDSILDKKSEIYELFKAEKDAAAEMIRDYTKRSQAEFFADMFTYWVQDSVMFTRDTIKECTPKTYEFFKQLDEEYHLDEVFAYTHEMRPVFDSPYHS